MQVYITKVKLNVLGMSTKYWFIVLFNGFAAAAARITSCIIKVTAQLGCRDTGTWLGNVTSGGQPSGSVQVSIEPLSSGWTLDSGQCPSTSCSLETNVTFLKFTLCFILFSTKVSNSFSVVLKKNSGNFVRQGGKMFSAVFNTAAFRHCCPFQLLDFS